MKYLESKRAFKHSMFFTKCYFTVERGYVPLVIVSSLAAYLLSYLLNLNYQFLHSSMEMMVVAISLCVFFVTLNTHHLKQGQFYTIIGIGYGFSAFVLGLHILASLGVHITAGLSPNDSTQLGFSARAIQTGVVLHALLRRGGSNRIGKVMRIFLAITLTALSVIIYTDILPTLFDTRGFTIAAKWGYGFLAVISALSFVLIGRAEHDLPHEVCKNLQACQVLNAIAFSFFAAASRPGDWASVGTTVLSSVSCYYFYRAMIKPILTSPIETLYQNIETYDEKLRRQEAEFAKLDQLNAVGQMAASIGHEIRNPLTTVRGYLQLMSMRQQFHSYKDRIAIMIEEIDRANEIITDYLSLAGDRCLVKAPHRLERIIMSLEPLLEANAFIEHKKLLFKLQDTCELELDGREIRQLILNLVRNAIEAVEQGGVAEVSVGLEDDAVVLRVTDTGPGLTEEVQSKLGMPFFTTKASGTGLGLAVCYSIAAKHNAEIKAYNGGVGAVFEVHFRTKENVTHYDPI